MIRDQPAEFAARFRKDGGNLARAMTDMLDALDRKRGKAAEAAGGSRRARRGREWWTGNRRTSERWPENGVGGRP